MMIFLDLARLKDISVHVTKLNSYKYFISTGKK